MSESFRDTIIPKSDQLNADDLLAGPITVKIESVTRGTAEQPIKVGISGGHQPYLPCKSMRRVMILLWGEFGKDWVGHSMRLYCDPNVKFGGVCVGGIRISHATGITETKTLMLTATRGKRKEFEVKPLIVDDTTAKPPYPDDKFNGAFQVMREKILSGEMTLNQVIAHCEKTGPLTQDQVDRLTAIGGKS